MYIPVNRLDLPELALYASRNETVLKRAYEPEPGLFITETANVILRALRAGYEAESLLLDEKLVHRAEAMEEGTEADEPTQAIAEILQRTRDIPVYTAGLETISEISGFKQSRGIVCLMKRRKLQSMEEVLQNARRIAVLEDVENPTNVGAIFRSAAGLGIDAVLLTYGSSDPLYRRATRVSMGGVFQIPWTTVGSKYGGWPEPGMETLRNAGFKTVSMALSDRAITLDAPVLQQEQKIAILFGNEQNGLTEETLAQSDYVVKIPMLHNIDSLNVAAASAVAFWELRRK